MTTLADSYKLAFLSNIIKNKVVGNGIIKKKIQDYREINTNGDNLMNFLGDVFKDPATSLYLEQDRIILPISASLKQKYLQTNDIIFNRICYMRLVTVCNFFLQENKVQHGLLKVTENRERDDVDLLVQNIKNVSLSGNPDVVKAIEKLTNNVEKNLKDVQISFQKEITNEIGELNFTLNELGQALKDASADRKEEAETIESLLEDLVDQKYSIVNEAMKKTVNEPKDETEPLLSYQSSEDTEKLESDIKEVVDLPDGWYDLIFEDNSRTRLKKKNLSEANLSEANQKKVTEILKEQKKKQETTKLASFPQEFSDFYSDDFEAAGDNDGSSTESDMETVLSDDELKVDNSNKDFLEVMFKELGMKGVTMITDAAVKYLYNGINMNKAIYKKNYKSFFTQWQFEDMEIDEKDKVVIKALFSQVHEIDFDYDYLCLVGDNLKLKWLSYVRLAMYEKYIFMHFFTNFEDYDIVNIITEALSNFMYDYCYLSTIMF